MTTTTAAKPAYRIMALEDAPLGRGGRNQPGKYARAFMGLAPNTVAEFSPCEAKHTGRYDGVCPGAGLVRVYAKRHGLKARTWHVNGNLYIARLE